jgi:hypothetical protein
MDGGIIRNLLAARTKKLPAVDAVGTRRKIPECRKKNG